MTSSSENVRAWTQANAEYTDAQASAAWAQEEITWGVWEIPESELRVLGDVSGLHVVELGCGTAYFSAWLARRGARVVGVDPTPAQLATARRMQSEHALEFPLVEAFGEEVPLADASFDLVLSEHGAATWADPYRWIPEAARLLRPGGHLIFLHGAPLATICSPDTGPISSELQRPYFGLHRLTWGDEEGVEFQVTHGEWVAVLRRNGFALERLLELQAPPDATPHEFYSADPEWGRKWPKEEIWVARKT